MRDTASSHPAVVLALLATAILLLAIPAVAAPTTASPGRLFLDNCAICHGTMADGNGNFAERFRTPPASFRSGNFKFKHTATGEPPLPADIERTLARGARGTGMVPQLHLSLAERQTLARFVSGFACPRESDTARALALPPEPCPGGPETVSIGADLYARGGCAACHGESGRSDGPSARDLRDARGRPVEVPQLAATPYKQGDDTEAVAWAVLAGRDGTPMPSFEGAFSETELWALSEFVVSLQSEARTTRGPGLVGEELLALPLAHDAIHAWRMATRPHGPAFGSGPGPGAGAGRRAGAGMGPGGMGCGMGGGQGAGPGSCCGGGCRGAGCGGNCPMMTER